MVRRETGDCVVVGVASGEREGAAAAGDCAAGVITGDNAVVGGISEGVPFSAEVAIPVTSFVAGDVVVGGTVVIVVVSGEVDEGVVVTVGTAEPDPGTTMADTGRANARARIRVQNRTWFTDNFAIIGDS